MSGRSGEPGDQRLCRLIGLFDKAAQADFGRPSQPFVTRLQEGR